MIINLINITIRCYQQKIFFSTIYILSLQTLFLIILYLLFKYFEWERKFFIILFTVFIFLL